MKKSILFSSALVLIIVAFYFIISNAGALQDDVKISGTIQEGYRVLPIPSETAEVEFTVYRGDYIKFAFDEKKTDPTLSVPALSIKKILVSNLKLAPYFKMKITGDYPFSLGDITGHIIVIEYDKPQYKVVTSSEASQLIENISPLILDVRTIPEYASGHLQNSIHIPVQEIQRRYGELSAHKDDNILIYCATGNRSTVAAKILIDNGFNRIFNLREGVHVWAKKGFPVVR